MVIKKYQFEDKTNPNEYYPRVISKIDNGMYIKS